MGQGVWRPMHPDHSDEYNCVFFGFSQDWYENLQYYLMCYFNNRLRSKSWIYNDSTARYGFVLANKITHVQGYDSCLLWYNSHFAIVLHESGGNVGLCYACRSDAPPFAKAVLDDRATALWKYLEQCGYGFYRRDTAFTLRPVKFNPDPQ